MVMTAGIGIGIWLARTIGMVSVFKESFIAQAFMIMKVAF